MSKIIFFMHLSFITFKAIKKSNTYTAFHNAVLRAPMCSCIKTTTTTNDFEN